MSDEINIFTFLDSINYTKKDIMTEENEKLYKPFLINRFLSASLDTVLYAQEMNMYPFAPARMQYDFFLHSIRKNKRYLKWLKKEKLEKIELLKEYFNYSTKKAEQIADLISDDQFEEIKSKMSRGGIE